MSEPDHTSGGAPQAADPLRDELEARAAELRALIAGAPSAASYGPPVGYLELRERRRRRLLLACGGALVAAGALIFVLIVTGVSLLGVAVLAPGVALLALALGWRPFYSLYLPGLALAGWGAGMIVDKALGSPAFLSLVGLGCGLALAWLIRRRQAGWAHRWPLVCGLALVALGVLPGFGHPWAAVWYAWPLVIVALGVALVVRAVLPGRRSAGPPART
jgi:hypothetical protein